MNRVFAIAIAVVSLFLASCTTVSSDTSQVNTPAGPLQAEGDLNSVSRDVTATRGPDGKIIEQKEVTKQNASNAADAKHEEKMAKIDKDKAIGVAQAEHPAPVLLVQGSYTSRRSTSSGRSSHQHRSNNSGKRRIRSSSSDGGQNVSFSTKGN